MGSATRPGLARGPEDDPPSRATHAKEAPWYDLPGTSRDGNSPLRRPARSSFFLSYRAVTRTASKEAEPRTPRPRRHGPGGAWIDAELEPLPGDLQGIAQLAEAELLVDGGIECSGEWKNLLGRTARCQPPPLPVPLERDPRPGVSVQSGQGGSESVAFPGLQTRVDHGQVGIERGTLDDPGFAGALSVEPAFLDPPVPAHGFPTEQGRGRVFLEQVLPAGGQGKAGEFGGRSGGRSARGR